MHTLVACGVAALATTASVASIPPAYRSHLPPAQTVGDMTILSGGTTPQEAESVKRAAQDFPLEVVFDEKDGAAEHMLASMPVTITDDKGRVVFEGVSNGPIFLARLPKGRYTVTTQWDDWTFSRPVTIGADRERVVFAWKREEAPSAG
ncbi:MAG: hypothetical protein ACXWG1_08710 [Usitatibacter sp.]